MKKVVFKAPWGAPLVLMTVTCGVICIFVSVVGIVLGLGATPQGMSMIPPWAGWLLAVVPLLALMASAAFMVRGYVLIEGWLSIKRLGWATPFNLSRLISATADPEALHRSIRLFGNGGCFSFTGWFRNKKLGSYRAYATDTKKAVVLRFSDRTIVVTPDDPQKFVVEISLNIRREE
jgi:hypothetical protein